MPQDTFRATEIDGATVELGDRVGRAEAAPAVALGGGVALAGGGATGSAREGAGVAVGASLAAGADASGVGAGVAEGGATLGGDALLGAGAAVAATDRLGVGVSDVSTDGPPPAPAQAAKRSPSRPAQAALPIPRGSLLRLGPADLPLGQEPRGGPLTR